MPCLRSQVATTATSDRGRTVISRARSRFEEIRRGTTPRSITHANAWHRGAQRRDRYQFFSRPSDPRARRRSRGRADVARRRITIWLAMTAARSHFARPRGCCARIELYGLICNARASPRRAALHRAGASLEEGKRAQGNERGADTLKDRARMLIGRARQGFPPQARIRLAAWVRGKRARRDRRGQISLARFFIRRNDAYPVCHCRLLKTELCCNDDEIAAAQVQVLSWPDPKERKGTDRSAQTTPGGRYVIRKNLSFSFGAVITLVYGFIRKKYVN